MGKAELGLVRMPSNPRPTHQCPAIERSRLKGSTHLHGLLIKDALVLSRVVRHAGDVHKLDAALRRGVSGWRHEH